MTGGMKPAYGVGLSYRPSKLHGLASKYDNPTPKPTSFPNQGLRIGCCIKYTTWILKTAVRCIIGTKNTPTLI